MIVLQEMKPLVLKQKNVTCLLNNDNSLLLLQIYDKNNWAAVDRNKQG